MKTIFSRIALFATAMVTIATSSIFTSCSSAESAAEEIEMQAGRSAAAVMSDNNAEAVSFDGHAYFPLASGNSCTAGSNGTFKLSFTCCNLEWMAREGYCFKDKTASKYDVRLMVAGFDAEAADYGQQLELVARGSLVCAYSNAEGKSRYFAFADNQPEGSVTFVSYEDGMLTVGLSDVHVVCEEASTGTILDELTINGLVTLAYSVK